MLSRANHATLHVLLVSCLLWLLPAIATSSGQPWGLLRVNSRPLLRRHDHESFFSLKQQQPQQQQQQPARATMMNTMLRLHGGGEVLESSSSLRHGSSSSTTTSTLSESMAARGGSTTAKRPKRVLPQQQQQQQQQPIKLVPTTPSIMTNGTTTTTATPMEVVLSPPLVVEKGKKTHVAFHKRVAKRLKSRNATNLRRKVMHACFGLFFAGLNHFLPRASFVPGMAVLSSATLLMELLRYRPQFGWMNRALHFVLGDALRKHEMDGKFTGSFYFFAGVTLTAALFPTGCATMGIIQLAIADPTASYFGRATRHISWSRIDGELGGLGRNKGILGFLGGALACVPINYRILSLAQVGATQGLPGGRASILLASIALGVAGSLADLAVPTPALTMPKKIGKYRVPPLHVDDNFVVPVVSGFACTWIVKALARHSNLQLSQLLFF